MDGYIVAHDEPDPVLAGRVLEAQVRLALNELGDVPALDRLSAYHTERHDRANEVFAERLQQTLAPEEGGSR